MCTFLHEAGRQGVDLVCTHEHFEGRVMEGPTHHYALGIGHHAGTIKKIGEIFKDYIGWMGEALCKR